jgi:thiamine kinase-like enzyme
LAALDLLPLVLCHNDANIDNLLIRPLDDSVAALIVFDVQWVGFSGVGTELGQLLCNVPTMTEGITRHRVETRVIDAYLAELNADGADITRDQVEFGYSASACLRQFHFGVALAAEGLDAALDAGDDRRVREIAEAFVAGVLNGPLPRLAARAIELIPTVEGR